MHAMQFKQAKKRKRMSFLTLTMFLVMIVVASNIWNNASGIYSNELNFIMLFPRDEPASAQFHTAAHEIGHYVYFKKLTAEDRLEYEKIFNDNNDFVSNYSKTDARENFAEEFAWATMCITYVNEVSQTRRDFFKNNEEKMFKWKDDDEY